MLYFIVAWVLLLITSSTVGLGLLHGLRASRITRTGDRLLLAAWLGILSLAVVLLTTALFLPLSPLVGAIVAVALSAGAMAFPAPRAEAIKLLHTLGSRQFLLGLLGVAIAVAVFTTQEVTWIDTGLYHYGSIQWFAQYGSVPGVTLLFSNYGFTSSWFALAAPLNPAILNAQATAVTNGFIVLLVALQCLLHLKRLWQQKGHISDGFMVIFVLLFIPLSRLDAISSIFISPSPDAPLLMLVAIIAWFFLMSANKQSSDGSELQDNIKFNLIDVKAIPLLFATAAVTLKLTALPLLFIALLYYSYHKNFRLSRFVFASGMVFLFLTPLFAHGLTSSGCPLYPSSLFCFNLPWSLSNETVQSMASSTHRWTSWYGSPPDGTPRWIWATWQWLNSSKRHILMVFLIALSVGCMGFLLRQRARKDAFGDRWVMALFVVATTFFMLTAPFFRFSLSYLLLLPALSIAIILGHQLPGRWPQQTTLPTSRLSQRVSWVLVALLVVGSIHNRDNLILPPPMKQVAVLQRQVNNVEFVTPPPGELCWSAEIPCTFSVSDQVVLRDFQRGIRAGFTWKK